MFGLYGYTAKSAYMEPVCKELPDNKELVFIP